MQAHQVLAAQAPQATISIVRLILQVHGGGKQSNEVGTLYETLLGPEQVVITKNRQPICVPSVAPRNCQSRQLYGWTLYQI